MTASTPQSRKQKGRQHQQQIAEDIRTDIFDGELTIHDVWSTSMGAGGVDIKLSEKARSVFPFAVECKRKEQINVHSDFIQTKNNARKEELFALLVTRRNRESALAVLEWSVFKSLLKRLYTLEKENAAPGEFRLTLDTAKINKKDAQIEEYISVLSDEGSEVDTHYQKDKKRREK